jgi:hypothetical protein
MMTPIHLPFNGTIHFCERFRLGLPPQRTSDLIEFGFRKSVDSSTDLSLGQ